MNKINQFLKRDNIQRRAYVILLICWIVISLNMEEPFAPHEFISPVILLVLQILFNNTIIWFVIAAWFALFTLWTFFKQYMYMVVDYHREVHVMQWNAASIFQLVLVILGFLIMNWFFFKIRPIKKS